MSDLKGQEAGLPPQSGAAYPIQPQAAYPQQPQEAYPQQPQGAYPQQQQEAPYPSQPIQQPYPGQAPYTGYDQPPPYDPSGQAGYPQQAQQTHTNIVVTQQPVGIVEERPRSQPELGIGAIVFAVMSTIFIASFLCWWALPCTIVGIILGVTAASYGSNGDIQTAKNHFGISIGCTVTGVIFSVVGLIVIIIAAVVSAANATNSVNRNF